MQSVIPQVELAKLYELSQDLLGIADFQGNFIYTNPAFQTIFGFTPEDLSSYNYFDFIHPDDLNTVHAVNEQLAQGESIQNIEIRFRTKDGSYRWIAWNASSFNSQIFFVGRDITKEKQRQLSQVYHLQRSERLLQLSDTLAGCCNVLDELLQEVVEIVAYILEADQVILAYVDLPNQQMLSFKVAGPGAERVKPLEFAELWESLSGWVLRENKATLLLKDNKNRRPAYRSRPEQNADSIIVVPIWVGEGAALGTLTIVNRADQPNFTNDDVTLMSIIANQVGIAIENTILFEQLQESEEQYRQFFENASDIVFETDTHGVICYANPIVERVTGYPLEMLVGKALWDIVLPEKKAELQAFFTTQIREQRHESYLEYPVLTAKGEVRWLGQKAHLLISNGQISGFQGIARDITELKRIEFEREALIQELDAFAHTVAHDLKNPLGIVLGYAELLIDMKLLDESDNQMLTQISRSAQQMSHIIDELLKLAALRRSDAVEATPLDMVQVIHYAIERLVYVIKESEAEIHIPDDLPVAIGYGGWVEEIWANYISNAIKYGGKPPVVETGATALNNGMVKFWVKDNGAGLTEEQQSGLFKEFSRIDVHSKITGHGLGLSIVKRIAERLGGAVGVESTPGEGSIFWFTLPAQTV